MLVSDVAGLGKNDVDGEELFLDVDGDDQTNALTQLLTSAASKKKRKRRKKKTKKTIKDSSSLYGSLDPDEQVHLLHARLRGKVSASPCSPTDP